MAGRERKREEGKKGQSPQTKTMLRAAKVARGVARNPYRAAASPSHTPSSPTASPQLPAAAPPAIPQQASPGSGEEPIQPGFWPECSVLSPNRPASPFPQGPPTLALNPANGASETLGFKARGPLMMETVGKRSPHSSPPDSP